MTKSVVNDWVVELGWDDSKVLAGQKKLSKIMAKVERIEAVGQGKATRAMATQERSLQKQNTLEAKRLSLVRSINRAKTLGVDVTGFASSARGSNPLRVDQRRLELERMITKEKEKQRVAASKVGAAPAQRSAFVGPRTPKDFLSLDSTAQLRMGQSIDAVVRRAGRGLSETSKEFQEINNRANLLKSNISQINSKSSLQNLRNELVKLRETTNQYTASARKANSAMTAQKFAANGLRSSVLNLARSYVSVFAAMEAGRAFLTTGVGFENMRATLLLTSGSTEQAADDMKFLTNMSQRLGIRILDTAKSFSKYGIAANSAGLSTQEMRDTFEDMAIVLRSTGLSQDKANLSFLAMQQMLSNGVVSMQELKLQLSEQLPQTMAAAEKALRNLGHTSGSVKDIISTGAVESGTFVKELTKIMKAQAMETGAYAASLNTVTAAWGRFMTAVDLKANAAFEKTSVGIQKVLVALSETFEDEDTARAIGAIMNQLLLWTADLVHLFNDIFQPVTRSTLALLEMLGVMQGLTGEADNWFAALRPIQRLFQFIAGIINIIVGANMRIHESLTEIIKSKEDLGLFGSLGSFWSGAGSKIMGDIRAASPSSAGTTVTGNTMNVTVPVNNSADIPKVKEMIEEAWQNTMVGAAS